VRSTPLSRCRSLIPLGNLTNLTMATNHQVKPGFSVVARVVGGQEATVRWKGPRQ
jgi:hypothetical protein